LLLLSAASHTVDQLNVSPIRLQAVLQDTESRCLIPAFKDPDS